MCFQVLTFDSVGSCTSTETDISPWTKTRSSWLSKYHMNYKYSIWSKSQLVGWIFANSMPPPLPLPFLQLSSVSLNQPQPTPIIQGGPASPETPSLNLRTVGLAVLPPKSPGTAKDQTASHQHLRVAIRLRWCLRFYSSKELVDSLSVLSFLDRFIQFTFQSPVQNWSNPAAKCQLFCSHSWKHLNTNSTWNLKMMISKLGIVLPPQAIHEMHPVNRSNWELGTELCWCCLNRLQLLPAGLQFAQQHSLED